MVTDCSKKETNKIHAHLDRYKIAFSAVKMAWLIPSLLFTRTSKLWRMLLIVLVLNWLSEPSTACNMSLTVDVFSPMVNDLSSLHYFRGFIWYGINVVKIFWWRNESMSIMLEIRFSVQLVVAIRPHKEGYFAATHFSNRWFESRKHLSFGWLILWVTRHLWWLACYYSIGPSFPAIWSILFNMPYVFVHLKVSFLTPIWQKQSFVSLWFSRVLYWMRTVKSISVVLGRFAHKPW